MPLTITTLHVLTEYVKGVINRADCHAQKVNEIVLTIIGAVIWKITQDVEVRTYQDNTANILWLTIGSNRYALAYNHQSGNIELRSRTQVGDVLATFNNHATAAEIKSVFAGLQKQGTLWVLYAHTRPQ